MIVPDRSPGRCRSQVMDSRLESPKAHEGRTTGRATFERRPNTGRSRPATPFGGRASGYRVLCCANEWYRRTSLVNGLGEKVLGYFQVDGAL